MGLVRIKVIRLKSLLLSIVALALIVSLLTFFFVSYLKPKTIAAMADISSESSRSYIQKIDSDIFKRMLSLGLPVLGSLEEEKRERVAVDVRSAIGSFSRILTNVDILNPETYFLMHLPLISMISTEMAMTPGVELPQEPAVENEHLPAENLPPPEIKEIKGPDVEKLTNISDGPLVLIYHTHTTEGYLPSEKHKYTPDATYHTRDLNYSVAKVGEIMAEELNRLNVPTLHDKTFHDVPTYMTSYANSLKTVEQLLKQHPSIKIVIDLHRDAPVSDVKKSREITTVEIDGNTYSRLLIVVGTDKTFPHPNWEENYRFATIINDRLEQRYPGISRGIDLRGERFNQHVTNKAILLEIGSHGNTMEESIASAKIFAEVLAEVVKELSSAE